VVKSTTFRIARLDKEEAGQWIARIDRGLTASEREGLSDWMRDPGRRDILLRLARDWDSMSVVTELAELFPLRESEGSSWPFAVRAAAAFVVAAAVASLAIFWRPHSAMTPTTRLAANTPQPGAPRNFAYSATYSTRIGERRTIELPDHSRIQLNTNSELAVAFSDDSRRLSLNRGEAMFEVAKDPNRVFSVHASGYEFKAIGTAFDIRADSPTGIQLTVTEGRVRVHQSAPADIQGGASQPAAPAVFEVATDVVVEANKAVLIARRSERIDVLTPGQVAAATAWQHGVVVFKATPLSEAVAELARYSPERFVIADPELGRMPVSGYFQVGDTDTLVAALQQNAGVTVTHENGYLLLSSSPHGQ